jgi:hypothetical protein
MIILTACCFMLVAVVSLVVWFAVDGMDGYGD